MNAELAIVLWCKTYANLWKFQYTENANIWQFILFHTYQITTTQSEDVIKWMLMCDVNSEGMLTPVYASPILQ